MSVKGHPSLCFGVSVLWGVHALPRVEQGCPHIRARALQWFLEQKLCCTICGPDWQRQNKLVSPIFNVRTGLVPSTMLFICSCTKVALILVESAIFFVFWFFLINKFGLKLHTGVLQTCFVSISHYCPELRFLFVIESKQWELYRSFGKK